MPQSAQRPCKGIGCPNLVKVGGKESYCPKCKDRQPMTPCRNSVRKKCPNLVKPPYRYCDACHAAWQKTAAYMERRRLTDERRGSGHKRGYGVRWRIQRKHKLSMNPLCQECERVGILVPAREVHHIDGSTRSHGYSNLMSVCIACHHKLDAERRRG